MIYYPANPAQNEIQMKQLDVVVSPPAFLWDSYLTLTNVIFELDICGF